MKNNKSQKNKLSAKIQYLSGPIKIKDGLFMGDQQAARDMEFIISNKVTHVINTVVKRVPNMWQKYGILYLSVHWAESQQNVFDKKNQAVNQIFSFIEQANELGQCVLVHSMHGKSRAATVVIAYLMKKFCWSLNKCLTFIQDKKQNLKIRTNFIKQLAQLQKRFTNIHSLSSNWSQVKDQEDLVLTNTMKNTKIQVCQQLRTNKKNRKRITWAEKPIVMNHHRGIHNNVLTSASKYKMYQQTEIGKSKKIKSILKGDKDQQTSSQQLDIQRYQRKSAINQNSESLTNKKEHARSNSRNLIDEEPEHLSKSEMIGNIRGNVVNVTVNNFITPEQNSLNRVPDRYGSIPARRSASNNTREVHKKAQTRSGSRLMPYQNIISSFKSPYDTSFLNKSGNYKNKNHEGNNNHLPHERPASVGDRQKKHKPKTYVELMASSSRKGAPYSLQRQHNLRYKI